MKLTISQRVALGYGSALVLLVAVAAIGVWSLRNLDRAYGDALTVERGLLLQGMDVQAATRGARAHFLDYLLTGDPASLDLRAQSVADARQIIADLQSDRVVSGGRWGRVAQLLDEWDRQSQAVVEAYQAGDPDEAERLRRTQEFPAQRTLDAAIQSAIDGDLSEADRVLAAAGDAAARSRGAILTGLAVLLVVGVVSAYLLARAVHRPLRATSAVLGSSAAQILAATTQQAAGATETLSAVTETAATVDEVSQTAEHAAEQAQAVAGSAREADEIGRRGSAAVGASMRAMEAIETHVESIAESIVKLTDQTQAISEIITTVTDMADQTNLLALNAAIEAARAGEQGRGFAVVAGEVRNLAEQSKEATVRVRQILGEVQSATSGVVMVTEQGGKLAQEGTRKMVQAEDEIRRLAEAVSGAAQAAAQIAASTNQQKTGVGQIREAIHSIREAAQQNLSATRQAEAASRDLNELGTDLMALIGAEVADGTGRVQG